MNEFNRLERAVLNWVLEHSSEAAVSAQIATASLVKRVWTEVGFPIEASVDRNCSPADLSFPIAGPESKSATIEHGACSMIWGENGYISSLELAAYRAYFGEVVSEFSLEEADN